MARPNWVHCILLPWADPESLAHKRSWCGRNVSMEYHFQGLDHAAGSNVKESRNVPCKACVDAAVTALQKYTGEEGE